MLWKRLIKYFERNASLALVDFALLSFTSSDKQRKDKL
jgi:hypothetical protein